MTRNSLANTISNVWTSQISLLRSIESLSSTEADYTNPRIYPLMEDYTHYRFHPERRRMQVDSLKPPLNLLEDWSMSGVACQPKIKEGKVFVSLLSSGLKVFEQSTATELWSFSPKGIDDDLSGEGDVLISGDTLVTRRGGK